jgi:RNA polymerase sigma factor (sigma-70 family)
VSEVDAETTIIKWFEQFTDIYRWLTRRYRDPELAVDATLATFSQALLKFDMLVQHPNPEGWLYRTADNFCRTDQRRWRRRVELIDSLHISELDLEIPLHEHPDQVVSVKMAREMLYKLISSLNERDRNILIVYLRGGSRKQMAKDAGYQSEAAFKSALQRAKQALAKAARRSLRPTS